MFKSKITIANVILTKKLPKIHQNTSIFDGETQKKVINFLWELQVKDTEKSFNQSSSYGANKHTRMFVYIYIIVESIKATVMCVSTA